MQWFFSPVTTAVTPSSRAVGPDGGDVDTPRAGGGQWQDVAAGCAAFHAVGLEFLDFDCLTGVLHSLSFHSPAHVVLGSSRCAGRLAPLTFRTLAFGSPASLYAVDLPSCHPDVCTHGACLPPHTHTPGWTLCSRPWWRSPGFRCPSRLRCTKGLGWILRRRWGLTACLW